MIAYETGEWALGFVLQLRGSVLPKALRFALPNALLAIVCHRFMNDTGDTDAVYGSEDDTSSVLGMGNVSVMWSSYTFVLGFLIVFRNNQAYQRFWQGAVTVSEISGDWFDAISCLFAFSNPAEDKFDEVNQFQQFLLKLGSMLFCAALQNIAEVDDGHLEVIELDGVDAEAVEYLQHAHCRVEVIMQWIQHLIVESDSDDLLRVPAPILSRVFQELSNGMVRLHAVTCIKEIPFPFPYAQMITGMLMVHWIVTPLLASQVVQSAWWAGILCFCIIGSFWSLIFIALEIDQPFGSDANDLPIKDMMMDWNAKLLMLMEPVMQCRPQYVHRSGRKLGTAQMGSDFRLSNTIEGRIEIEDSRADREEIEAVLEKTSTNKTAAEKARRRLRLSRMADAGEYDPGSLIDSDSEAGSVCSKGSPQSKAPEIEAVPAKRLGVHTKKDAEQVFKSLKFGNRSSRSSVKTSGQAKKKRNSENSFQSEFSGRTDGFAEAQPSRADGFAEAQPRRADDDGGFHEEGDGFADSATHEAPAVHANADSRYPHTLLEASVSSTHDVASDASGEEHVKC